MPSGIFSLLGRVSKQTLSFNVIANHSCNTFATVISARLKIVVLTLTPFSMPVDLFRVLNVTLGQSVHARSNPDIYL